MAKRSKSGLKRKRQAAKRRLRNLSVRSSLKTLAKQATTPDALRVALAALDEAAGAGVIHRNAAARKKSRLVRRLTRTQTAT